MKTVIEMARIAGARDDGQRFEFELRDLEFLVALVRLDERERIKQENAPVIASINAHIQTLEEAAHGIKENNHE